MKNELLVAAKLSHKLRHKQRNTITKEAENSNGAVVLFTVAAGGDASVRIRK
jgi:hypothetical protein